MTKNINPVLSDEMMDVPLWIVQRMNQDYHEITVVANGKVLEFGKDVAK